MLRYTKKEKAFRGIMSNRQEDSRGISLKACEQTVALKMSSKDRINGTKCRKDGCFVGIGRDGLSKKVYSTTDILNGTRYVFPDLIGLCENGAY